MTQLIAMVVIGVVSTVVLLILGVNAAVPLGVIAGLLEFVPTVGPILSALPAIAMGFVESPREGARRDRGVHRHPADGELSADSVSHA